MCTMQAPHRPAPQPNLVPVSFKSSRITHSSGVSGGAFVVAALPFTRKLVAIASSLDPRAPKAVTGPDLLSCEPAGMAIHMSVTRWVSDCRLLVIRGPWIEVTPRVFEADLHVANPLRAHEQVQ